MNNRYVGIQHRVKETVLGEARPTIIALVVPQAEAVEILEMETELDELDFVLGQFPTSWRSIDFARDSLSNFPEHHVKWRKLKDTEDPTKFPQTFLRDDQKKGGQLLATKVPKAYDGLAAGDVVSAMFGGSGDMLILAMAHRAEDLGAQVFRMASPKMLPRKVS